MLPFLDDYSIQEIKDTNWFFPILLLIKESFNMIGCETKQATTNKKVVIQKVVISIKKN